jgi:hypothetical protein
MGTYGWVRPHELKGKESLVKQSHGLGSLLQGTDAQASHGW